MEPICCVCNFKVIERHCNDFVAQDEIRLYSVKRACTDTRCRSHVSCTKNDNRHEFHTENLKNNGNNDLAARFYGNISLFFHSISRDFHVCCVLLPLS